MEKEHRLKERLNEIETNTRMLEKERRMRLQRRYAAVAEYHDKVSTARCAREKVDIY